MPDTNHLIHTDLIHRMAYSTDASPYRELPLAVGVYLSLIYLHLFISSVIRFNS